MTAETKRVAREPTREMIDAGEENYRTARGTESRKIGGCPDPDVIWHAMFDAAPAAAPSDRERRLHEALREAHVTSWTGDRGTQHYCALCNTHSQWDGPEHHAPGCLAAPLPQEGE
jgi:hypothetical protein